MIFQSVFYMLGCCVFIYIALLYTKMFLALSSENCILKRPLYLSLDEKDFNCLVRGGVLKIAFMREGKSHLINIGLQDIGYTIMNRAIENAEKKENYRKDHNKIIS